MKTGARMNHFSNQKLLFVAIFLTFSISFGQQDSTYDKKIQDAWHKFKSAILNSQKDSVVLFIDFPLAIDTVEGRTLKKEEFLKTRIDALMEISRQALGNDSNLYVTDEATKMIFKWNSILPVYEYHALDRGFDMGYYFLADKVRGLKLIRINLVSEIPVPK
jgi:hypothetical protein